MSLPKLQRRLGVLERQPRSFKTRRRTTWDLDCFTVEELEEMVPLAEKYEQTGAATVWTAMELAVFERLAQVEQQCRSRA